MTTKLRLVKLKQRLPRRRPPSPASGFDPAKLTSREQYELDRLLCCLQPGPGETCDTPVWGFEQEARLRSLNAIACGAAR